MRETYIPSVDKGVFDYSWPIYMENIIRFLDPNHDPNNESCCDYLAHCIIPEANSNYYFLIKDYDALIEELKTNYKLGLKYDEFELTLYSIKDGVKGFSSQDITDLYWNLFYSKKYGYRMENGFDVKIEDK